MRTYWTLTAPNRIDELPVADTPEDVAVLYSWANLHGAKYRDFSASRREYRAQLRHRAAEQVKEQELKAQAEAEAAASAADAAARQAQTIAQSHPSTPADSSRQQALREAGRASQIASAERVEAAARAEGCPRWQQRLRRAPGRAWLLRRRMPQRGVRLRGTQIRRFAIARAGGSCCLHGAGRDFGPVRAASASSDAAVAPGARL